MLIEQYSKEARDTLEKVLAMYNRMEQTAETISLDFVSDSDSVEAEIDLSSSDLSVLGVSIEGSKEKIKDISLGITQCLERYVALSDIVERRKAQLKKLDLVAYNAEVEEVHVSEDDLIREKFAPLFAGLSEQEIQERIKDLKKLQGE